MRVVLFSQYWEGCGVVSVVQPLLALQEIDERIRALQQEVQDVPEREKQEKKRLKSALDALALAQSKLKIAQLNVSAAEGDVENRKGRADKLREQQLGLKNNRDFQAMSKEIARADEEVDQQEARLIAALDEIKPAQMVVTAAEAKLRDEESEINGYIAELERRAADAQAELERQNTLRETAVKQVTSKPALLMYSRLLGRRWPVVVPLNGGVVCGGCHLNQPPQTAHLARRNEEIVTCQMCGRILYLA